MTAIHYKVVAAQDGCDGPTIAETTVVLEAEALPPSVLPPGAGTPAGADALFVLPPGVVRVCATPLAGEAPSAECAPVSDLVSIVPEFTNEVLLVSECGGANGAADVIVALNDPPRIDSLVITPSKFITVCETATITATATDPNGDPFTFSWTLVSSPPGSAPELDVSGSVATFHTTTAGDYSVKVTASDAIGGSSLTFPIHVSDDRCGGGSTFNHAFDTGATTQAACNEWNGFRSVVTSGSFNSIVVRGSADTTGRTCTDPALATQICNALGAGITTVIGCQGHTWSVGPCGNDNLGQPAIELSVDTQNCACASPPAETARPCIEVNSGNPNWGGVGTETCSAPAQTIEVTCQ